VVVRWCDSAAELRRGASGYARTIQTLQRHQLYGPKLRRLWLILYEVAQK
jgi:hypothetical protein